MDRIHFVVNGEKYSVGSEVDSDVSLNDYIRTTLGFHGTKYMCKEGGCGACIVTAAAIDHNGHKKVFSVNSCLVSITSCQDWEITTIEGIGDRRKGYHPLQRALAEYNGTQCGYCSPGWVMSMYSLLESNNYDLTQYEIENSFGSNTCRCTGYRPILDAFKSFAKDAPKPKLKDIEDLQLCSKKGECSNTCKEKDWCFINKSEAELKIKKIILKDDRMWYRVNEIKDIFDVLNVEGYDSYMLVGGNTARGAVPILEFPKILIDISPVQELKVCYIDQNLVIGAGTTLTDLMAIFKMISQERQEFSYLIKLYEHLDLVAHIPVRNIGTIAGNLLTKHRDGRFSSDVFLLLEAIGATLTIVDKVSKIEVTPEEFLSINMKGKVMTLVKVPPLSQNFRFVSFKIMPRAQNAHAQVNGAYLYEFDSHDHETVNSARIVYGGISETFVHARNTEKFLRKRKLFTNKTLQVALEILRDELKVEVIPGELKPEYRKKCALGIFYKGLLNLIPEGRLRPFYRSGARDFRKTRPLSSGIELYDTNPLIWPITEPMPKIEALIQTSGECFYINDMPTQPREVFCAFATTDICVGEIESIDPSPALKIPGVLAFFTVKDIPGVNNLQSLRVPGVFVPEKVFVESRIDYYDQPYGVIVAETEKLANRAALLIKVKYRKDNRKVLLTVEDVQKNDPSRISLFIAIPPRDRGVNVQRVIKGEFKIDWKYHYAMETLTCVSLPNDDGLDVYPTTQWTDHTQTAISEVLGISENRINITVPRCGGGYGSKITRGTYIGVVCSLVSYLMNRPARFVLSIQANLKVIGKRLPCYTEFEVGVNNSGEIQYMEYNLYEDNGYVTTDLSSLLVTAAMKNCYDNRRWHQKIFDATTDTANNTYCRAPGCFEAIATIENIMERISYEIGRDPVEVRLSNINVQYTDVTDVIQTLLRDGEYYARKTQTENFNKANRWKKRGLRVAIMSYATSVLVDYNCLLTIYHADASVVIQHGGVELGQGSETRIIQAVAYTLNLPMDKIKVKFNAVTASPNNFTTGSSRTTQSIIHAAIKCCQIILDRLTVVREALIEPTWEILIQTAFLRGINLQASYRLTANDQVPYRVAGAAMAEVELDILTGEHEILRVDIVEDCGTSLNPELDIGQVEGAFVMGIGHWTHEHLIYDENTGEILTDRTWYYKVPHAKDIPIDFRVQLRRNSFNPIGSLGSRAVSEPPISLAICVAFALREAITDSRVDSGIPRDKWFDVEGAYTLEANILNAETKLEEFKFD